MKKFLPALVVVCTAAGSVAHAGSFKHIKDTDVTCGNGLTCDVVLNAKEVRPDGFNAVTLRRQAGKGAQTEVIFWLSQPAPPKAEITLIADGRTVAVFAAKDVRDDVNSGGWTVKAPALPAALRDAAMISVKTSGKKPLSGEFSLAGVAGALLFADEAQGRLGVSNEKAEAGKRPPALAEDVVSFKQLPASIRAEFTNPEGACGFPDESAFTGYGGFVVSTGEGERLWCLPCGLGGAYNVSYAFYLQRGERTERVALPVMGQDGPEVTDIAQNVDWNHAKREMTAFSKGRGIGDCGTLALWQWREDRDPPGFVLKEMRVKDECDGKAEPGPEGWPLVWPPSEASKGR